MITDATSLNNSVCDLGKKCFKSFLPTKLILKNAMFIAGFKSTLAIDLLNDEGSKVPIAACFLSIKITDPWETELPVTLNTTDPELTVTFTPQRSGRHDITVMYLGQELRNDQNHVSVEGNNPVLKIGGPGDGNGTFKSPRGIAIDNNNCLYVADTGNGLIQKFTAEGEFLSQFPVNAHDRSYTAFDVALDLNKGLIICTETWMVNNLATKGDTMLHFNFKGELTEHLRPQWNVVSSGHISYKPWGTYCCLMKKKSVCSKWTQRVNSSSRWETLADRAIFASMMMAAS